MDSNTSYSHEESVGNDASIAPPVEAPCDSFEDATPSELSRGPTEVRMRAPASSSLREPANSDIHGAAGTTQRGLPNFMAHDAACRAPERRPAWTTTTAS